uniref:Uncharacterized protein n=1 Tax=Peronospora matthiolae TaxID=2874970 RepID=A0AAV1T887_9STRA
MQTTTRQGEAGEEHTVREATRRDETQAPTWSLLADKRLRRRVAKETE